MAKILVGGSIAYDNIMDFPGEFKDQILPDKIQSLNVSFLVNSLKRVRGGTAPNISYNLALIGQEPYVVGTAGLDFTDYSHWLNQNGVNTQYIRILPDDYTATCYITTDSSNNQITGFYPGAMSKDIEISLKAIELKDIDMMVVAPTEPAAMVKWARECTEIGLPYLFDAGMQIPRLSESELAEGIRGAKIAVFNEYEYDMMLKKTSMTKQDILDMVELLVITMGGKGSRLLSGSSAVEVPAAKPVRVVDPTGAGDAYRAGLLKGYFEGASLEEMGLYASVSAVYAVENKGPTEHKYTIDEFNKRYYDNFRKKL